MSPARLAVAASLLALSACNCGPGQTNRTRPEIEADPTSVDFGRLAPGASASRTVTVVSRGLGPVAISAIAVEGDGAFFAPPTLPRELAPGEDLEVTVTYAPQTAGAHAARLVVTSDAVNAPDLRVPLVGDAAASCQPTSCAAAGKNCGTVSDGCTGQLSCGSCSAPESCGGGGVANVCGCTPEPDAALCARLTKNCGSLAAADSCGQPRTVSCGSCTAPATCGGGGTANVCACAAETDAAFCTRLGKQCGPVTGTDACGAARTVDCGGCAAPETCGGGGTANACGCAESDAAFCGRLQKSCGAVSGSDACGAARTVDCGSCTSPQTCGGGGTANVCGCAETDAAFCTRLQKDCGTVNGTDACGQARTASCGTCTAPAICGTTNVCACTAETNPAFCARLGAACGTVTNADNCGSQRTVDCGQCGTCTAPGVIPPLGHVVSGTTSGASAMSNACGGGGAPEQVWSYTPQVSGSVTVSSCGSSFDTVLSVLSNTCPGGAPVTCNDNSSIWCPNGTTHSYVTWNAAAGTTYYVVVDGSGGGNGWYNLRVSPPDGTCANPVNVPANGGTLRLGMSGNSTDAASCGGTGGDKVHRWVAPRSGTATVTMVPDFWPATLYVRQGSCTGAQLACDNKNNQWPTNTVSFAVTAGTTYYIWASYGTYNGPVVSIYDLTVSPP